MKTTILSLFAFVAAVLLLAGTQGCYTQVGSTREEQVYVDDQAEGEAAADTDQVATEEGDYAAQPPADAGQDWTCQMRMGFDYYYPSTYWPSIGFSFAYNDPWYGWGYPWYSYGYPYYGYPAPYYGYGYGYGYGYPYYPYDPWYGYPGYGYPVTPVPWQNREFGSTRTSGNSRGTRGVDASNGMRGGVNDPQMMDLQSGSVRTVTGGTAAAAAKRGGTTAAPEKAARASGSSRKDVTRKMNQKLSPGQQGTGSSRTNSRLYRDRSSVSGSSSNGNNGSSPSMNSSPPSGGASSSRGTGAQSSGTSQPPRSGGTSVRSAPAPAPRPSSPPPSSGGSRGGGGGRNPRP